MVDIKMTKGKYYTVGTLSMLKPYLVEWHCVAYVNSQMITQSYVNYTKAEAKAKFKQLIKDKQKAWNEYLAK